MYDYADFYPFRVLTNIFHASDIRSLPLEDLVSFSALIFSSTHTLFSPYFRMPAFRSDRRKRRYHPYPRPVEFDSNVIGTIHHLWPCTNWILQDPIQEPHFFRDFFQRVISDTVLCSSNTHFFCLSIFQVRHWIAALFA